jgi:hypothetical protein
VLPCKLFIDDDNGGPDDFNDDDDEDEDDDDDDDVGDMRKLKKIESSNVKLLSTLAFIKNMMIYKEIVKGKGMESKDLLDK